MTSVPNNTINVVPSTLVSTYSLALTLHRIFPCEFNSNSRFSHSKIILVETMFTIRDWSMGSKQFSWQYSLSYILFETTFAYNVAALWKPLRGDKLCPKHYNVAIFLTWSNSFKINLKLGSSFVLWPKQYARPWVMVSCKAIWLNSLFILNFTHSSCFCIFV
jgi:hypothetical protein